MMFFLSEIFLLNFISGLGVTPAKIEMNFEKGFEDTFEYYVSGISTGQAELSLSGPLSKYASLDKEFIEGNSGSFKIHLNFFEEPDVAGKQRIRVIVKEINADKELASAIGTSVTLTVAIDVYVPYPGKYIEIEKFTANNANIGEQIRFDLTLTSRGKEIVNVFPRIEIYSIDNKNTETLSLKNRTLESGESIELVKFLETSNYLSGNYNASLIVDYANKFAQKNLSFKLGELNIEILNYTRELFVGGIQKFQIDLESTWNNEIDGAYADVFIFNSTNKKIIDFKTSSTNLIPWERKSIEGYFDTTGFQEGSYNANITLNYYGRSVGQSKSQVVEIELIKEESKLVFILIIISLLLILVLVGIWFLLKKIKKSPSLGKTSKNNFKNPLNKKTPDKKIKPENEKEKS